MYSINKYDRILKKYASNNLNFLGRQFREKKNYFRSEYQRDRDRVIHSNSFRRLKFKTQVFVYHEGDHYRTRLTHSLEVSQISRSIARYLNLNEDLCETLSLAHDLGHPPFGHAGEKILNNLSLSIGGFDHNIHSLRLITELENPYRNYNGLNLSLNTLDGLIKHNGPNFSIVNDLDILENLKKIKSLNFLNNSSLEAQISSISDDIAYNNHDLDDGLRAGLFSLDDLKDIFLLKTIKIKNKKNKLFKEEIIRSLINYMVTDLAKQTTQNIKKNKIKIIDDVYNSQQKLVSFSTPVEKLNSDIREFLKKYMYENINIIKMNDMAEKVIIKIFKYSYKNSKKVLSEKSIKKWGVERAIIDFIAGMTDKYAMDFYYNIK